MAVYSVAVVRILLALTVRGAENRTDFQLALIVVLPLIFAVVAYDRILMTLRPLLFGFDKEFSTALALPVPVILVLAPLVEVWLFYRMGRWLQVQTGGRLVFPWVLLLAFVHRAALWFWFRPYYWF